MKHLVDENLSYRLVRALSDLYPDSTHVREVGLRAAPDGRIWRFAGEHGLLLVSKDSDFYQRSLVFGAPPKVIWLRIGNGRTGTVIDLLRAQHGAVERFWEDSDATFLTLAQR